MPVITLETKINAPLTRVFDLARSIDLHKIAAVKDGEKAIAGRTTGLIGLNETVTWEATHFYVKQQLTSKITAFEEPNYFVDEMEKGFFKSLHHLHQFEEKEGYTIMTDVFTYQSPLGIIGKLADAFFLKNYLKRFIIRKNTLLKEVVEGDEWKKYFK